MSPNRTFIVTGLLVALAGLLVAAAPVYTIRASQEPAFQGTLWYAGLPLLVVGLALAGYGWRREGRTG